MKHTDAPWKLVENSDRYNIRNKSGCTIAIVPKLNGGTMQPEMKPNAELIAAAPQLLDALQSVLRHGLIEKDGYESVLKNVNAVIKKATV